MIEIKVNGEVRDVTSELWLGLNAWQLMWCILGVVVGGITGVISYFIFNVPPTVISYIAVIVVLPFGFMGFYTWHQMTAFEIVKLLYTRLKDPKVKLYQGINDEYIAYMQKKKEKENRRFKFILLKRKNKGEEDGNKNID